MPQLIELEQVTQNKHTNFNRKFIFYSAPTIIKAPQ